MEPYELYLNEKRQLVHIVAHGELSIPIGKEIITQGRLKAAEAGYSILYDVRQATVQASVTDWYYLPRELQVLHDNKTRNIRVAILISTGVSEENYQFYSDVMHNLGMDVQIFFDEDDAIAWLTPG